MNLFKKYKNKPKEIEAIQFTDENKNQVFNELAGRYAADFECDQPILKIETIRGDVAIVRFGDWIIKEKELGKYYPIKDHIFRKQYEDIEE